MPNPSADHEANKSLSPTVRAVVSLAIFIHLFTVMLGLATNFNPVSELRARFRVNPFVSYLTLLHMDSAYNFHYMYGDPLDFDQVIEVEIAGENPEQPTVIRLPDAELPPGLRRQRFEQLAQSIAEQAGNEDTESILPQAIADHLLARLGVEELDIRCRTHLGQSTEDVAALDPAQSDPNDDRYFQTAFDARVWLDGGFSQILKREANQDSAPAASAPPVGPALPP